LDHPDTRSNGSTSMIHDTSQVNDVASNADGEGEFLESNEEDADQGDGVSLELLADDADDGYWSSSEVASFVDEVEATEMHNVDYYMDFEWPDDFPVYVEGEQPTGRITKLKITTKKIGRSIKCSFKRILRKLRRI
jgi:hypothetical protein